MDQCLVQRAAQNLAVEVDSLARKKSDHHILDHIDLVLAGMHHKEDTVFDSIVAEGLAVQVVDFDCSSEEVGSAMIVLDLAERQCFSVGGSQMVSAFPILRCSTHYSMEH